MSYLVINGGRKLSGTIHNQTAKNSALGIICACLAIKGKTKLVDVPQIEEINRMIELLSSIGVEITRKGTSLEIDASGPIQMDKMDKKAATAMRSSILLFGGLASRVKEYKLLYKTGGCILGDRTVMPHVHALNKIGMEIKSEPEYYSVKNKELKGTKIVMYESGDTATENIVMATVLAEGTTTIKMGSSNYMVQDLCYFLQKAGAQIKGIGTSTLVITGVKQLDPVTDYSIMPDPIVAMTYLSAAITTESNLTVTDCPLDFLELEICKLQVMGQKLKISEERLSKNGHFSLVDIEVIPSKLTALPNKIYGRPFPGLNVDNLSLFVPILAKAEGRTLVHDWAYENRSVYYLELVKLGGSITLLDPHRVWIEGKTDFVSNEIVCPPALRPAAGILIAMLAAKGKSVLRNTYSIERGYENLYAVLNSVGADIRIINE